MLRLNRSYSSISIKVLLVFTSITILAYLPITSMLFALKNDAFTGYFPPKFFMSESIHSGYWPLWNPYIDYGIPQYGDMSSAFWNPLTWLIASTVGYNAYTFTIEEIFYIFLAGTGMYKLLSYWHLKTNTRIVAGISYMCCGYMVGHLQHFNWISGAAFLPWCVYSYLSLIRTVDLKNILKTGLFFLLFVSAAHPGLIIAAIYYFLFIIVFTFYNHSKKNLYSPKLLIKNHLFFLITVLLFCIGIVIGYTEMLPFIERGDKISLASALSEPTTLQSWISLIIPLATTKNDSFFATDIAMRNCYIGLPFLLAFIHSLFTQKSHWQIFFLIVAILFFLLSLGGIFKGFAFNYIPYIGYVRLNGEFRIFTIFSLIILAAFQLDKEQYIHTKSLKRICYFLSILLLILIIFSLSQIIIHHNSIFFGSISHTSGSRYYLKTLITNLTFYDAIFIQSIIQLCFLLLTYNQMIKRKKNIIKSLFLIEIILATLMNIPFTGVGKASVSQVQEIYKNSPKGIPIPPMIPTDANDIMPEEINKLVGDWSFYSKQIGTTQRIHYPIFLKSTAMFFTDQPVKELSHQRPVFMDIPGSNDSTLKFLHFSPESIKIQSSNLNTDNHLILKQNYYPKWECYVNNINTPIKIKYDTFMSVEIPKNKAIILFKFNNVKIKTLVIWTLFITITASCFLLMKELKKRNIMQ